uniref:Histone deacetylase interacting domain-containing protein n=1 Tax=Ananas comosus var. bracteatus TaxID=296719 RepID=A0A6V7P7X6_ANACO|nr:unnamed protein product [Ananas comosus var. bracteatus]
MDSSPHLATEKRSSNKKLSDLIERLNSANKAKHTKIHQTHVRPPAQQHQIRLGYRGCEGTPRNHPDLIRGFNTFLPRVKQREMQDKCTSFLNKLKHRFLNDENCICSSFVRISSMYRDRSMSVHQFCEKVAALFSAHPDLLKEFEEFLPDAYRKPRCSGGDIAPAAASLCVTIGAKTVKVDDPKHRHKRQHARNKRIRHEPASCRWTASKRAVMEPSEPLDTSNLERCTPSYCILPKNYRLPVASYMSELNKSVLNDTVVLASKRKCRR